MKCPYEAGRSDAYYCTSIANPPNLKKGDITKAGASQNMCENGNAYLSCPHYLDKEMYQKLLLKMFD